MKLLILLVLNFICLVICSPNANAGGSLFSDAERILESNNIDSLEKLLANQQALDQLYVSLKRDFTPRTFRDPFIQPLDRSSFDEIIGQLRLLIVETPELSLNLFSKQKFGEAYKVEANIKTSGRIIARDQFLRFVGDWEELRGWGREFGVFKGRLNLAGISSRGDADRIIEYIDNKVEVGFNALKASTEILFPFNPALKNRSDLSNGTISMEVNIVPFPRKFYAIFRELVISLESSSEPTHPLSWITPALPGARPYYVEIAGGYEGFLQEVAVNVKGHEYTSVDFGSPLFTKDIVSSNAGAEPHPFIDTWIDVASKYLPMKNRGFVLVDTVTQSCELNSAIARSAFFLEGKSVGVGTDHGLSEVELIEKKLPKTIITAIKTVLPEIDMIDAHENRSEGKFRIAVWGHHAYKMKWDAEKSKLAKIRAISSDSIKSCKVMFGI